jgi:hypothetical protein
MNARGPCRAALRRRPGPRPRPHSSSHPGRLRSRAPGRRAAPPDARPPGSRPYIAELGHLREGSSSPGYAYYDRYQRTPDGWKFTGRVYEVRYPGTAGGLGAQRGEGGR